MAEVVYTGNVFELVRGRARRAAPHLQIKFGFFYTVAGEFAVVLRAPVVQCFIEYVGIQLVEHLVIAHAERVSLFVVLEKGDDAVGDVFAVALFPKFFRRIGKGRAPAVILRFVGEKSDELFAEPVLKAAVIFFVRHTDEFRDHVGIEDIGIGGRTAHIHAAVLAALRFFSARKAFARRVKHGVGRAVERVFFFHFEVGSAELLFFQQFAAHKTARPAVFVVDPGVHFQLGGLIEASLHQRKPLV